MHFRVHPSVGCAIAGGLTLATMASTTSAATVHFDSLPSGVNASFSKASSPFMYLEGESLAQSTTNADTFATPGDSAKTFFRTSSNPASGISSAGFSSPASRFATYGGDVNLNVGFYWEDQPTNLPAGSYDVFARAYPTSGGSYSFTLYTGTSLAEVNTAAIAASAVSTSSGAPNWFKVGTVDLGSTTDTFRFQVGTTGSAVRFDTLMFTAVPEPTTLAVIAVCGGASLRRRSRRVAG